MWKILIFQKQLSSSKDEETGFLVGHIPGITGAHSQGETLEELYKNLKEVLALIELDSE